MKVFDQISDEKFPTEKKTWKNRWKAENVIKRRMNRIF